MKSEILHDFWKPQLVMGVPMDCIFICIVGALIAVFLAGFAFMYISSLTLFIIIIALLLSPTIILYLRVRIGTGIDPYYWQQLKKAGYLINRKTILVASSYP